MNDLTGKKFGRLSVLQEGARRGKHRVWRCLCECGSEKSIFETNLFRGLSSSCGCLQKEVMSAANRTHGLTKTMEYRIWSGMHVRCQNTKRPAYKNYGGRGIAVCARWRSFVNFLADMGECPRGLTLDRKDNDKGYYKSNCRWATRSQQARNRSSSRMFTFEGKTLCMKEWSEAKGIGYGTLYLRLKKGAPFHLAIRPISVPRWATKDES